MGSVPWGVKGGRVYIAIKMSPLRTILCLIVISASARGDDNLGSRQPADLDKAETELQELKTDLETGKLYFTGTGYTVNLIPHALILGLLTFGIIFLYGDALFGSTDDAGTSGYGAPSAYGAPAATYGAPAATYDAPAPSYSAPAPAYGAPASAYSAAQRYYDPYAANAATGLGADAYNPELNPYNIQQDAAADQGRKKRSAQFSYL